MNKTGAFIRIISSIIDYIIVSIPVIFIMIMWFGVSDGQAELLMKLLFVVYGVILMETMDGATVGKRFGKVKVVTAEGTRPTLVELGMRELVKTLYFIPIIGWGICIISLVMLFLGEGRTIHDRIAKTKVIYVWEQVKQNEL